MLLKVKRYFCISILVIASITAIGSEVNSENNDFFKEKLIVVPSLLGAELYSEYIARNSASSNSLQYLGNSSATNFFYLPDFAQNIITSGGRDIISLSSLDDLKLLVDISRLNTSIFNISSLTTIESFLNEDETLSQFLAINWNEWNRDLGDPLNFDLNIKLQILNLSILNTLNANSGASYDSLEVFEAISKSMVRRYRETAKPIDLFELQFISEVYQVLLLDKNIELARFNSERFSNTLSTFLGNVKFMRDSVDLAHYAFNDFQKSLLALHKEVLWVNKEGMFQYLLNNLAITKDSILSAGSNSDNPVSIQNNKPTIISKRFTVPENRKKIGILRASDADGDDLVWGVSSSAINLNSSTGAISFKKAPNYESKRQYKFNALVSDGKSIVSKRITVKIRNKNEPPVLNIKQRIKVKEGTTHVATFDITDPENGELSISISGKDSSKFKIVNNESIKFKVAPDFENPQDANQDNKYVISLSASDGKNTIRKNLRIVVQNLNEPPVININKKITARENRALVTNINISDGESNQLELSLSGADSQLFKLSGNKLLFKEVPDFENPKDANKDNKYKITINVSDGTNQVSKAVTIVLKNINDNSPKISKTNFSIQENKTRVGKLRVSDKDGNSLTLSLSGGDAESLQISSKNILSFKEAPNFETKDSYTTTLDISDGVNVTSTELSISITNVLEDLLYIKHSVEALSDGTNRINYDIGIDALTNATSATAYLYPSKKGSGGYWGVPLKAELSQDGTSWTGYIDLYESISSDYYDFGQPTIIINNGESFTQTGNNNYPGNQDFNMIMYDSAGLLLNHNLYDSYNDMLLRISYPESNNLFESESPSTYFYSATQEYPDSPGQCTTTEIHDSSGDIIKVAVIDENCFKSIASIGGNDGNPDTPITINFSIYHSVEVESAKYSIIGHRASYSAESSSSWTLNGEVDPVNGEVGREIQQGYGDINRLNKHVVSFTLETDGSYKGSHAFGENENSYSSMFGFDLYLRGFDMETFSTTLYVLGGDDAALFDNPIADETAPRLKSLTVSPIEIEGRTYLDIEAIVDNSLNSNDNSSAVSSKLKDIWITFNSPSGQDLIAYLHDEGDDSGYADEITVSERVPLMQQHVADGPYTIDFININDRALNEMNYSFGTLPFADRILFSLGNYQEDDYIPFPLLYKDDGNDNSSCNGGVVSGNYYGDNGYFYKDVSDEVLLDLNDLAPCDYVNNGSGLNNEQQVSFELDGEHSEYFELEESTNFDGTLSVNLKFKEGYDDYDNPKDYLNISYPICGNVSKAHYMYQIFIKATLNGKTNWANRFVTLGPPEGC